MKTLLLFLFACTACIAQEFTVTRGGLASKEDNTQYYVIANFEGISADTLYSNANKYVQKNYRNLGNTIKNDDENKSVTFETTNVVIKTVKKGTTDINYFANYSGNLEVKDGKVKIAFTNVDIYTLDAANEKKSYPFTSYWNKKGKIIELEIKKLVEENFNASTRLIIAALKGENTTTTSGW